MTVGLVGVLVVACAVVAVGVFGAAWRRDISGSVAMIPVMFAGAGIAFAGVARFAAAGGTHLLGQEFAVLLAIAAVALVALGLGIAGRAQGEAGRAQGGPGREGTR